MLGNPREMIMTAERASQFALSSRFRPAVSASGFRRWTLGRTKIAEPTEGR
jgi:hypothetical protein